jgi:hypothetical protein
MSCPGLTPGAEHKLYAYIESAAENSDGHLYGPISFTVPKSNGFTTVPYLGATPTQGGVVLKYQPSAASGKSWVVFTTTAQYSATGISQVKLRSTDYPTQSTCWTSDVAVSSGSLITNTYTNCGFLNGTSYWAHVYVEDNAAANDGTLHSFMFNIPNTHAGAALSNSYSKYPVVNTDISTNEVKFQMQATAASGKLWAAIVETSNTAGVDALFLKSQNS